MVCKFISFSIMYCPVLKKDYVRHLQWKAINQCAIKMLDWLLLPCVCFLHSLKTSENHRLSVFWWYKKGTLGSNTLSDIKTLALKYFIFLFGVGTNGLIRKVNLSFFADLNQILLEGNWPITFPDYSLPLAL